MTHLEEQLQHLKEEMTEMSRLANTQIQKSINSLLEDDADLAREVVFNEKRVNAMELAIDKDCENILALLNPFATDMRFVFATLKINTNYERIGDNAEGIANYVLLSGKKFDEKLVAAVRFIEMGKIINEMLAAILRSYTDGNAKLARSVFKQDNILDEINSNAADAIVAYCKETPDNMHQALYLLTIIRKLERVGDHITNIAEEIIFYLEAKVLKHGKKNTQTGS